MSLPAVAKVVGYSITGQKPEHYLRDRNTTGFKQKVKMVGDQCPCKTFGFGFFNNVAQAFNKISAVGVALKDWSTFDPPGHDVMQGSGGVYAGFSWHAGKVAWKDLFVK